MSEKLDQFAGLEEKGEEITDLETLTDQEFNVYCQNLGKEIAQLSQEEIEIKILQLLKEVTKRDTGGSRLFHYFDLPDTATKDEIQSGQSAQAKLYRALFNISSTSEYKENHEIQEVVRELENIVDQDPQMVGPVAMWQIAKDIMWRKDIPSHIKGGLMHSMTYALAFFDVENYESELLKNLDFENTKNYAETAHILEALKYFWAVGNESYAEDHGVPNFYLKVLEKIKATPKSNYLLSVRAREISTMLGESEYFPTEVRDVTPFELSKGVYAFNRHDDWLRVVPEEKNSDLEEAINDFNSNNEEIHNSVKVGQFVPPHFIEKRDQLFNKMRHLATIPIEEKIGEISNLDPEEKQQLLFDYEYLVSRPMREIIQREFNFELKDLSFREQFYFLNYLKQVTVAEVEKMKQFTSDYGVAGLRTFLSLEQGGKELGDRIVDFGQNKEVAGKVFEYYSQLLDRAEQAETLVKEASDCEGETCLELAGQVYGNIVNRAQKDLKEAVLEDNPQKVADRVETYIAEAKEYVALLQEVGAGKIEEITSQEISPEDQAQMKALLTGNYNKVYPGPENEAFRKLVSDSLEKSFTNPQTVFKVLRDKGKIVSFNRFDTIDTSYGREVSYFGSFSANPAYSGVGSVMLEETVKERLEDGRPMMAYCDPGQNITKKYIEDGFIATGFFQIAGQPSFEIWRSKDLSMIMKSKTIPTAELLAMSEPENSITVRKQEPNDTYPELKLGQALTRYFTHEKEINLVFEVLPNSLQSEFVSPEKDQQKVA